MISRQTKDEILTVAKIEEVVGEFVSLKRRGQNYVGICPFHDDKNPSMYVTPHLGIYKCFVCDAGGDAVHFLMEHEKISFPEALRYLAKKYNIEIEEDHRSFSPEEQLMRDEKESMYLLNQYAEKYFTTQLFDTDEGQAIGLNYFKERGFSEDTIRKFKLGYNPDGWDVFTKEALRNGYKLELLVKNGLTKQSEQSKIYDFYRGRVIFPIHNAMGKVAGFGARTLKKGDKMAKYFNTPENEIYHKSDLLYGFFFARKSIRQKDNVYLVEGYTDVISLAQAGVENVVASSGTALTDRQVKLLSAQSKNITVLYDGDAAGIKASLRGIDMLVAAGMNVRTVLLPEGDDPDSFARKCRDTELQTYLEQNATDFLLFKVKILSREAGNDPMKRATMVNEIINTIAEVRDPVARTFYARECAEIFKLSEELLQAQVRQAVWSKFKNTRAPSPVATLSTISPSIVNVSREQPLTEPTLADICLERAEEQLLILLLKQGMYDIYESRVVEQVSTMPARETLGLMPVRVDQYVANELLDNDIQFSKSIHEQIFEEYCQVAATATAPELIQRHFTTHEQKDMRDFAIRHLFNSDPEYSPGWEIRYDITIRTTKEHVTNLQKNVEDCINMLKLRKMEHYRETLQKELEQEHPDEVMEQILKTISLVNQRRKEIAEILGVVITR